jgi:hypothetical protein
VPRAVGQELVDQFGNQHRCGPSRDCDKCWAAFTFYARVPSLGRTIFVRVETVISDSRFAARDGGVDPNSCRARGDPTAPGSKHATWIARTTGPTVSRGVRTRTVYGFTAHSCSQRLRRSPECPPWSRAQVRPGIDEGNKSSWRCCPTTPAACAEFRASWHSGRFMGSSTNPLLRPERGVWPTARRPQLIAGRRRMARNRRR